MLDVNRLLTRTNVDTGIHRVRAADLLTFISSRSQKLTNAKPFNISVYLAVWLILLIVAAETCPHNFGREAIQNRVTEWMKIAAK